MSLRFSRSVLSATASCLTLMACGCRESAGPGPVGAGPLRVVATTSIIADAVQNVGGQHVTVTTLMPAGTDPHNYLPTSADTETFAGAHLILSNGLHLEGKMSSQLEGRTVPNQRAATVSSRLDHATQVLKVDGGAEDPHVWFDVKLWMTCVETVRDELTTSDPSHADAYRANAATYLAELAALDAEVLAKATKLANARKPTAKPVLITSHDAFVYFSKAYGFEVHGLQGVSTASATSSRDTESLVTLIGERGITAIFTETSVPPRGLKKVLDDVKVKYPKLGEVRLVEGPDALYSDSLGPVGTPGATYVGMVRHNIDTIGKFLQP